MLQLCSSRGPLRRFFAAATCFALAVQLILSAAAIVQLAPLSADAASDMFVICHGAGDRSTPEPNGPAKEPQDRSHCLLCTLTNAACAILPVVSAVAIFDAAMSSQRVILRESQVTQFHSPTGEYQRGPPRHIPRAG